MKKILFVLLIAVIFCSQIAEENKTELDLDDLDVVLQNQGEAPHVTWEKVKNDFDSAVEFFKKYGVYDTFVTYLKANVDLGCLFYCQKNFYWKLANQ